MEPEIVEIECCPDCVFYRQDPDTDRDSTCGIDPYTEVKIGSSPHWRPTIKCMKTKVAKNCPLKEKPILVRLKGSFATGE